MKPFVPRVLAMVRRLASRGMQPHADPPARSRENEQPCPSGVPAVRWLAMTSFSRQGVFLLAMTRIRNVFEIIELYGHDENFEPVKTDDFVPTAAPAGSRQKIDILAERIQRGMPLWHPEDSTDMPVGELVGA